MNEAPQNTQLSYFINALAVYGVRSVAVILPRTEQSVPKILGRVCNTLGIMPHDFLRTATAVAVLLLSVAPCDQ